MLHYGDICELNGAEMPPVDVITGDSPCQDLSVAGKREGLAGARSGLFMEQIRIVKEMREATNGKYPRFMVWENVTGCFSSNKGEDFRCVLEETAKIADENAVIPGPPKGKWTHAGCIVGDGWSIAWRVHDAQFWGVPQRRRRICLVADFAGQSAGEILFELRREAGQGNAEQAVGHPGEECGSKVPPVSESVSGHPAEGGEEGQETPGDAGTGTSETGGVVVLNDQGGGMMHVTEDVTGTLRAQEHGHQSIVFEPGVASRCGGHVYEGVAGTVRVNAGDNLQAVVYGIGGYNSEGMKSQNPHSGIYEAETARTLDLNGGNPACNQGGMAVVSMATKQLSQNVGIDVAMPLCANDYKEPQVVCVEGNGSRPSHRGDGYAETETMYTLNATEHHGVCIPINTMVATRTNEEKRTCMGIGESGEPQFSLSAAHSHAVCVKEPIVVEMTSTKNTIVEDGISPTLTARMGTGGNQVNAVLSTYSMQRSDEFKESNSSHTLAARDYKDATDLIVGISGYGSYTNEVAPLRSFGGDCSEGSENLVVSVDYQNPVRINYIVRRLTPMECERLQGFPDGWTDIGDWVDSKGKKHKGKSDSPRYKALGNSIALPFWEWMAKRMVKHLPDMPCMGSLFSGIGGFEVVFSRAGCPPAWCSEIEEFCVEVTKRRFGNEQKMQMLR